MTTAASSTLLLMACSATKLTHAAPAIDLYRGVMYGTYRANVKALARPHVVILSARHGFIPADTLIEPYEERMTPARADDIARNLDDVTHMDWPRARNIMFAGGADYRRVMRSAIHRLVAAGTLDQDVEITETTDGIGYQRQQLGAFLRRLTPGEVVGYHPNGTPLYGSMGDFTRIEEVDVVYPSRPDIEPAPAVIDELFDGPCGPTANVRLLNSLRPSLAYSWVGLNQLRKKTSLPP